MHPLVCVRVFVSEMWWGEPDGNFILQQETASIPDTNSITITFQNQTH